MTENFRYTFKLEKIKLDNREYRQDSDVFLPHTPLYVSVDLPRENDLVLNLPEVIQAELSSEKGGVPEPVLTSKGFAYIKQQLEVGFALPKTKPSEENWDDPVETEKKLEPGKVEDWGNTTDPFKAEVTEEKWDDKEEKW